ncbi:MAG TPA: hypothetical protein PKI61_01735 [bacterium]|nr:hypothetical protein [bacterium]HPT30150.1 hypothetical protein [bacterium]
MQAANLTAPGNFFWQLVRDIIYFPLWWYSFGFLRCAAAVGRFWARKESSLGLSIWLRNLFVPMYGQRDFLGRFVSFLMRSFQIVMRSILMLFYLILGLAALVFWLGVLPAWIYGLITWF